MTRVASLSPTKVTITMLVWLALTAASPGAPDPAAAQEPDAPAGDEPAVAQAITDEDPAVQTARQRLGDAYRQHGERFVEALLLAECSGDFVRRQLPDIDNWVGFESAFWQRLDEEQEEAVFMAVAEWLAGLEPGGATDCWREWSEWMDVAAQVRLLVRALADNGGEVAMQRLSEDPLLSPAFDFVRTNRGPEFPDHLIGVTLASAEATTAWMGMVRLLLETDREERFACFSRLYALAADHQAPAGEDPAEAGLPADPGQ